MSLSCFPKLQKVPSLSSLLCYSERDHPPGHRRGSLGPAPPVRLAGRPQQCRLTFHWGVLMALMPLHPSLLQEMLAVLLLVFSSSVCPPVRLHELISKCLTANQQPETSGLTFLTHSGNHSSQRTFNFFVNWNNLKRTPEGCNWTVTMDLNRS